MAWRLKTLGQSVRPVNRAEISMRTTPLFGSNRKTSPKSTVWTMAQFWYDETKLVVIGRRGPVRPRTGVCESGGIIWFPRLSSSTFHDM
eukprot:CAMPEP_0201177370 /NCGR_PEP_ID=MMETSP0851-20130426/107372_1 /ASSEMBLY_ACC=CAM_ASM_000631 /TAXON_ID=183588 /ORGANISM="Pseudo-nitzschia fraudulenta, Strain WWA7" /LENGTH=88 /DNA_ID=CAMNT_0047460959 /DNA_START=883 /DNA_END=1149 /DNA_ORIENTATION=+